MPSNAARIDYRDFITISPERRAGKPCIRDLRLTVYDVLEYMAGGMSNQDILHDFPELTLPDLLLAFAADRERRELPVR
jgi:uncharacterized protein (DUF433 family)